MRSVNTPAVVCQGLHIRFDRVTAVAPSNLIIPGTGVTAVIGANGSGKSSLLNAIAGLHPAASGSISVLGEAPEEISGRIAYVLQSTKVNDALPVTVREVVAMGRYASRGLLGRFQPSDLDRIDQALEALGLADISRSHLHELSGGQRQRVFVAQGLVQDHDLLLLDEPRTALDLVSTEVITQAIDGERERGIPVVLTTHDMAEAREADHVVVMAGRVVASGSPAETLTPQVIAEAYGLPEDAFDQRVHVDDAAHNHEDEWHQHMDLSAHTHDHEERR
ncbi:MAG: ATP-binding cassette domain-containing protein [Acidimicrobiia bacterium]|nr:ATP-binding cassette domain-containing protein [Acidimicrobiia bacterium]